MKRCPLCERPWVTRQLPPLWRKIQQAADGTRSYKDLAKLVRSTPNSVAAAIGMMRLQGIEVKTRNKDAVYKPNREDYEMFRKLRGEGLSWKTIGQKLGVSEAAAWRRAHRLGKAVGVPMPGRMDVYKRTDPARDFIRIKELRVDAQLPWKMVGKSLGMNSQHVARYFSELCKQGYR